MRIGYSLLLLCWFFTGYTQNTPQDSVKLLQPVIIQAYATGRPLNEVAASIGYIDSNDLQRFSNTSLLPAVNTIPGVRMEERSPGSYRFSIRGSLLRSPFGVRNVKMYWNNLPLTDGGGNTYLNLLDFNSIGSMEIIKGPGGSLYGAGTGGVVLLNSPLVKRDLWEFSALAGSYGLQGYQLAQQFHSRKFNLRVQFSTQSSDGYREQASMRRHSVNADLAVQIHEKGTLSATLFYSNLSYETPGGLSKTQYDENPSQARPAAGANRSAVEQNATVYNQTPYIGIAYDHEFNERWLTRVGVFGSSSAFDNPAIRNYEQRDEDNLGARMENQYRFGNELRKNKFTFGAEFQLFKSSILVTDNDFGVQGALQSDDDLDSRQMLYFSQLELELPNEFYFTAGASVNFLKYYFRRNAPPPAEEQTKKFDAVLSPRIALLKKVSKNVSVYGSVSRGFSPPSGAEVRPSTNAFNNQLEAEKGINYETGFRGTFAKISFDAAVYDFKLKETIITQRLDDGADYFINAGETSQRGIEAQVSWNPRNNGSGFISDFKFWNSYSYNHYRFKEYINDGNDFSGNKITGVPPTVNTSGVDMTFRKKVYARITGSYADHIPLNDANDIFASEYFLLGSRIGYKTLLNKKHILDIFAGVDNALNQKYSLGNDLNANFGGRYFNAAAPRNFFGGVKITLVQ